MTDKVIDRQRELVAMEAISAGGFGAKLIALFANGTVQTFINARTLTSEEMCSVDMIPKVARTLAKFHSLVIPGSREPQLWQTLQSYLSTAQMLSFEDPAKLEFYESIDFKRLNQEVQEIRDIAQKLDSPTVFCHNDLLSGNLMYDERTDTLHVIDFEYSAYGPRGYDIGNHFCEYAGFECDYSRYPEKSMQDHFFRNYLNPEMPLAVSEKDLEKLWLEVQVYALASHLFWGTWALVQARYSPIDFDYLLYFRDRYKEFQRCKIRVLPIALKSLNL